MSYIEIVNKRLKNILTKEEISILNNEFGSTFGAVPQHFEKMISLIHNEKIRESNEEYSKSNKRLTKWLIGIGIMQCLLILIQCTLMFLQIKYKP